MRLGGDEFAAFALGVHTREESEKILERFYKNIENIEISEADCDKISVSAGVTFNTAADSVSFEQLYEDADQSMYESKAIRNNQITYH